MKELSLHIMDILQNSTAAGATVVAANILAFLIFAAAGRLRG